MPPHFNLLDEAWIPISDVGKVSLLQVFSQNHYRQLGGNPLQKIALMKLLLAIAQAAATPADEAGWQQLGAVGLAQRCQDYLQQWREAFYLYGERPFLQMPAIARAALQNFGAVSPEIAVGNTTVLTETQQQRQLDDADKALLLLTLMNFALGGKKTDNSIVLSPGYQGKTNDKGKAATGKPGAAVAHQGLLHSFLLAETLQQTLWLNLLTQQQIQHNLPYPLGLGCPPWEAMPAGEDCPQAQALKQSLQGRLLGMGRFCLLQADGLHYSEGLAHPGYKDGVWDPSVAINLHGKEPRALWSDPEKRPWRELTGLLSFLLAEQQQGWQCPQLKLCLSRCRDLDRPFAIWSAGLRVSSNAGEQYVSGTDDFVESTIWLDGHGLGESWFAQLSSEMVELDKLAKLLYAKVKAFFKVQNKDGSDQAAQGCQLFWQLCEPDFQTLIDSCTPEDTAAQQQRQQLRQGFARYVEQIYDQICPKSTARQLDAWAESRPQLHRYITQEA
ncbi:type I-E CRISPR-associated protein Cse1/CasA [Neisseriaceae bacterium TC5R-5]|nr:type I-E CRISPR-associated protein Cse1/CasA [Neisseriaceae bacterium TC5R-5]